MAGDRDRRRVGWGAAVATIAVAVAGAVAGPAVAGAGASPPPPGAASFAGRTISLADGWQGAAACVVHTPTSVQCFSSVAQLEQATGEPATPPAGAPGPAPAPLPAPVAPSSGASGAAAVECGGGYLYLYQNVDFGGQVLALQNYGFWVDLANYGFADETSSWWNSSSCSGFAATGTNGSGSLLSMPAGGESSWVGSAWNDVIQSAYLGA